MIAIAQLLLTSAFAPFVLWPIEQFFPNPQIVEELAKTLIILPFASYELQARKKILLTFIAGTLFAFTEAVFYLTKIFTSGGPQTFLLRLALTVPLHGITYIVILIPALVNKKLIVFGFALAVLLHYLFNTAIGTY